MIEVEVVYLLAGFDERETICLSSCIILGSGTENHNNVNYTVKCVVLKLILTIIGSKLRLFEKSENFIVSTFRLKNL